MKKDGRAKWRHDNGVRILADVSVTLGAKGESWNPLAPLPVELGRNNAFA